MGVLMCVCMCVFEGEREMSTTFTGTKGAPVPEKHPMQPRPVPVKLIKPAHLTRASIKFTDAFCKFVAQLTTRLEKLLRH